MDSSWEGESAQLGTPYPSSQIILEDWPGIEGRPAQMWPSDEKFKGRSLSPTRERPERDIPQQLPPLQEHPKPIENQKPLETTIPSISGQLKKLPSLPGSPMASPKPKDALPPIQRPPSK